MANSFKDLLLRIGIDDTAFIAGVNKLQRRVNQFANDTERLGKSLTTNITLPLGLAGAAAIKTFADFDRLEKGLDVFAAQGTTGAEELDKLLDVVKDARTTLDLKSAASGALQLQAVGIEADKARNIIKQLGIAATVSGSEIADISEIVRQFAQSLSLGRVLETDLRIIKQRIPAIGKILKDEFGTVTAEGLRSAGVSANEFVDRLVAAIETNTDFQNVQISAAKAIETFTTNIQIAVAEIGKAISESIDLVGFLDSLANSVSRVTNFFKSLDSSTKELIVKIALFAASLGPLLLAISGVAKAGLLLTSTVAFIGRSLLDLLKVLGLSATNLRNIVTQFGVAGNAAKGFSLALRSIVLPIGAVIAAGAIIKKVFDDYKYSVDQVNRTQDTLNRISQTTNKTLKERTVRSNALVSALKDENVSNNRKQGLLDELNKLTDNQFKSVKILNGEVEGLTEANNNYIETLKAQIKLDATIAEIRDIEAEKARIQKGSIEDINISLLDYLRIGGSILSGGGIGGAFEAGAIASKNAQKEVDSLNETLKELYKTVEESFKDGIGVDNEDVNQIESLSGEIKDIFADLQKELEKIDYFGALFEKSKLQIAEERLAAIKKALSDAYDIENASERTRVLGLITQEFVKQQAIVDTLKLAINDYNKTIQELGQIEFSGRLERRNPIDIIQDQLSAIRDAQIDIPVESIDFIQLEDKYDELVKKLQTEVKTFVFNDLQNDLDSVKDKAVNFALTAEQINDIQLDKLYSALELVVSTLGEGSAEAEFLKTQIIGLGGANAKISQDAYNDLNNFNKFLYDNAEQIQSYLSSAIDSFSRIITEGFQIRDEAKQNLAVAREELLKLENSGKASREELEAAEAAVISLGNTVASNDLFANIGRAIKQLVVEIVKAIAKALILATLISIIFPTGSVIGTAIAGQGGNVFNAVFSGALGFADGGLVYGPVNAVIGEGQGTNRRNPEVVAPLDKLKGILAETSGGDMMLTSRLSGADLLLSVERAKRNRSR